MSLGERRFNLVMVLRSGGDYTEDDVHLLARRVRFHCGRACFVTCLTDLKNTQITRNGVTFVPLRQNWPGWWSKMELFCPDLDWLKPVLYLDLDSAIVGDVADLIDPEGKPPWIMLKDFYCDRHASGMMWLAPGFGGELYERFVQEGQEWMEGKHGKVGDQAFIGQYAPPPAHWQDIYPGRISSFKPRKTGVSGWLHEIPAGVSVVCFHGYPRPRKAAELVEWVREYLDTPLVEGKRMPEYEQRHTGTLLVVGSGPGALEHAQEVLSHRPTAKVAVVGHAAGMIKADFIFSDHYEVHQELKTLQSQFHSNFSNHCCRMGAWKDWPAVDYWWRMPRARGSSAETAIRAGLRMGFGEVILAGCPLAAATILHPHQQDKDGQQWPPPRDVARFGGSMKGNTSQDVLQGFQQAFKAQAVLWKGKVFSMSGYTRRVLGAPDFARAPILVRRVERPAISILCPSRGRPDLALRMVKSIQSTAAGSVEILVYLDHDDPTRYRLPPSVQVVIGNAAGVGKAWNLLARMSAAPVLMMANDDLIFRTPGWDAEVLKAAESYQDSIYVIWCNDGSGRTPLPCCFPFVSQTWVKTLGTLVPECFHFLYHDTWIWEVGSLAGRCECLNNVEIEHLHFSLKKARYDATYQRHRAGTLAAAQRRQEREAQAQQLKSVMRVEAVG